MGFIGETATYFVLTTVHQPKSLIVRHLMTSPPDPLTFCHKKLSSLRPRFLWVPPDAVAGSSYRSKSSLFVAAQDWWNRRKNHFADRYVTDEHPTAIKIWVARSRWRYSHFKYFLYKSTFVCYLFSFTKTSDPKLNPNRTSKILYLRSGQ